MHKTLICVEKRDFQRIVDVSRHYAGEDLKKCYIFNKKGLTAEFCKEREIDGVECIIFGWSGYKLSEAQKYGYDLIGLYYEIERTKRGYILMEFEDNQIFNYVNKSRIPELAKAVNIDKIITKNDFDIAFSEEVINEEEEEFE